MPVGRIFRIGFSVKDSDTRDMTARGGTVIVVPIGALHPDLALADSTPCVGQRTGAVRAQGLIHTDGDRAGFLCCTERHTAVCRDERQINVKHGHTVLRLCHRDRCHIVTQRMTVLVRPDIFRGESAADRTRYGFGDLFCFDITIVRIFIPCVNLGGNKAGFGIFYLDTAMGEPDGAVMRMLFCFKIIAGDVFPVLVDNRTDVRLRKADVVAIRGIFRAARHQRHTSLRCQIHSGKGIRRLAVNECQHSLLTFRKEIEHKGQDIVFTGLFQLCGEHFPAVITERERSIRIDTGQLFGSQYHGKQGILSGVSTSMYSQFHIQVSFLS